ncbi:hypothetical protein E8E11_003071 [Didymella keratinophila]|nr:hypothetical protein E8E11_003071 [Didymella keratinophila]
MAYAMPARMFSYTIRVTDGMLDPTSSEAQATIYDRNKKGSHYFDCLRRSETPFFDT